MTAVDLRAETRAYARSRLRDVALDSARDVVLEKGWGAVRMGAIATQVGISRQSLHAEFGTKDDLGNALVMREMTEFFDGVRARLEQHPGDLRAAVSEAVGYMVRSARDNPLVETIITRAAAGGDVSLLSLLTVRGEALLDSAIAVVGEWVTAQWPTADPWPISSVIQPWLAAQ